MKKFSLIALCALLLVVTGCGGGSKNKVVCTASEEQGGIKMTAEVVAEFDSSGVDDVEATLNMATLGSEKVTLVDGSEVTTDMYVKLVNNMPEIAPSN